MADLSLFDLTGKKALVTGGAVGIGRGCAVALAKAGADVAIADLNEDAGNKTAEEIRSMGVNSLFVACDVTKKDQVQAMVGAGRRKVRSTGHCRQQCGHRHPRSRRGDRPGRLGQGHRRQPDRHVPLCPGRGPADDPENTDGGQDHQHRLHVGHDCQLQRLLRRVEGGRGPHDQDVGCRVGPVQYQCQLHQPQLPAHAHARVDAAGRRENGFAS
jgi:hypothetical protein